MKKKAAIVLILLGLFSIVAVFSQEQEITISEMLFLPQKYYVGDIVELRISVRTPELDTVSVPDSFANDDWLDIIEVQVEEQNDGVLIRIVFRSFYPGTRTLPPLDFKAFTLDNVKIHTSSIITETSSSLRQPREQMYLPGSEMILVLIVLFLIIIPLFSLFLAGKIKQWFIHFIILQKEKKPIRRFYRHLDELGKQAGRISSRDFYIELTNSLRKYLSLRSGKDYLTITTKEINKQITPHFPGIRHVQDLVEVLRYSDEIKFSQRKSSYYKEIRDIELILRVVNAIEEKFNGKRNRETIVVSDHPTVVSK